MGVEDTLKKLQALDDIVKKVANEEFIEEEDEITADTIIGT